MLAEDPMADEKLAEGIRGFSQAIKVLEAQLRDRLSVINEFTDHDVDRRPETTRRSDLGAPLAGMAA